MRRKFVGVVAIVSVLAVLAAACSNDNKGVAATGTSSAGTVATTATTATTATNTATAPSDSAAAVTTPDSSSDATPAPIGAKAGPPFTAATTQQTFIDTSRPTSPAKGPKLPSRTIVTTIVYPQAPGPFPLIVLSHGLTGLPSRLSQLSTAWAQAGYVVALPQFPLTNATVPDAVSNVFDVNNQPKDVSFVIDQVLAMHGDDASPLFGRIDANHIGVAGHSLGAATTYGVAFNGCCKDPRIKAVMILAGFVLVTTGANDFTRKVPILIIHGDADATLNIALDQALYPQLAGPKWFITLIGADHSTAFEDSPNPDDQLVKTVTTDFWNGTLAGNANALDALATDAGVAGVSTLQSNP